MDDEKTRLNLAKRDERERLERLDRISLAEEMASPLRIARWSSVFFFGVLVAVVVIPKLTQQKDGGAFDMAVLREQIRADTVKIVESAMKQQNEKFSYMLELHDVRGHQELGKSRFIEKVRP